MSRGLRAPAAPIAVAAVVLACGGGTGHGGGPRRLRRRTPSTEATTAATNRCRGAGRRRTAPPTMAQPRRASRRPRPADVRRAGHDRRCPICNLAPHRLHGRDEPDAASSADAQSTTRSTAPCGPTAPPSRAPSCSRRAARSTSRTAARRGRRRSSRDCVSPDGIPNGPADTGKWVFPVGTVMIKNFLFDGKLVETRLFMHVDARRRAAHRQRHRLGRLHLRLERGSRPRPRRARQRTSVQFATGQRR